MNLFSYGQVILRITFAISCAIPSSLAIAADRSAIWNVVHNQCQQNQQKLGNPDPCVELSLDDKDKIGFAVLKDIKGDAHYLIIPTKALSGIEDADLLKSNAANWFAIAWQARRFLDQVTHRAVPRYDVALAINSREGRGQDQLHIHVACILPSVKTEIDKQAASIGNSWSGQTIYLGGNRFYAERVDSTLTDFNPIQVVANEIPEAKADMGRMTIIVVGVTGFDNKDSFFVFAGRSNIQQGDRGKSEDLLDVNCQDATK